VHGIDGVDARRINNGQALRIGQQIGPACIGLRDMRTGTTQRIGQRLGCDILRHIVACQLRDDHLSHSFGLQRLHIGNRQQPALSKRQPAALEAVRQHTACDLCHRHRTKLHGPDRRRHCVAWASTDSAISAGVRAPMASPAGPLMRANCVSLQPRSAKRCSRRA
jgi:cytochrome c551/c552